MAVGAVVARILTQYSDKGSKAASRDIQKLGKSFDAFAKKATRAFALAGAAVAAFAVKVGKDAVQAAIADQKSQVLLANSLRNTVGATNAAISAVEDYIGKLEVQLGVTDDQLRPAMAKLAAVTGSVTAAQELLGIALDVSAFSGADLGSATTALTRALQGNFRGLQKLVPSISTATIKSKDFAAIMAEVQKATEGAAASRAGTLEYKLEILKIRFNNILEALGYQLLPIVEKFAETIQKEVLPQIEKWIATNKVGLVNGFKKAAEAGLKVAKAVVAIGFAISENIDDIILLAGLVATMWVTSKVYAFAKAIAAVSLAFNGMKTAAAGAAGASAAATGASAASGTIMTAGTKAGVWGTVIAAFIATLTMGLGKISPGEKARAKTKAREQSFASASGMGAPGVSDLAGLISSSGGGKSKIDKSTQSLLDLLNRLNTAQSKLTEGKKKELSVEQKIINATLKKYGLTLMTSEIEAKATAYAIDENLKRQGKIAKSSQTISLASQGNGSASNQPSIMGSGVPNVNVSITTSVGTAEDFTVKIANDLGVLARRQRGSVSPSGRPIGMVAE